MNPLLSKLASAMVLGCTSALVQAQTVVLNPSLDNTLFQSVSGTVSNGAGPRGFCGATQSGNIRRFVVQFDVASAIPAGSTINSVTLGLTTIQVSGGGPLNPSQTVHRVSQAWGEGTSNSGNPGGQGAPATAGDATWLHAFNPTTFWANPGGDFSGTAVATLTINSPGSSSWSSSAMVPDVQDWLDNPTNNFGWLIKDSQEVPATAISFGTSESTVPTEVPTLTITYTAPGSGIVAFCNPADNNSTGVPTVLQAALGSGIGSGLHLEASSGPPTQFGYFLVGSASATPGIPLGSGHLCLSLTAPNVLGRYNVAGTPFNSVGLFDGAGVLQNAVGTSTVGSGFDVPTILPLPGSPAITAGSTWHFQLWHRENAGGSNFSNGQSVTF